MEASQGLSGYRNVLKFVWKAKKRRHHRTSQIKFCKYFCMDLGTDRGDAITETGQVDIRRNAALR